MKEGNKRRSRYTVIVGEAELAQKTVVLKDMTSGEQESISAETLAERLKS